MLLSCIYVAEFSHRVHKSPRNSLITALRCSGTSPRENKRPILFFVDVDAEFLSQSLRENKNAIEAPQVMQGTNIRTAQTDITRSKSIEARSCLLKDINAGSEYGSDGNDDGSDEFSTPRIENKKDHSVPLYRDATMSLARLAV